MEKIPVPTGFGPRRDRGGLRRWNELTKDSSATSVSTTSIVTSQPTALEYGTEPVRRAISDGRRTTGGMDTADSTGAQSLQTTQYTPEGMLDIYGRSCLSSSGTQAQTCTSVASSVEEVVRDVKARQKRNSIDETSAQFEKSLKFNDLNPGHPAIKGTQTYLHWRVRVGPRVFKDGTCLAWVINLDRTVWKTGESKDHSGVFEWEPKKTETVDTRRGATMKECRQQILPRHNSSWNRCLKGHDERVSTLNEFLDECLQSYNKVSQKTGVCD